jgi:hypothetical protein
MATQEAPSENTAPRSRAPMQLVGEKVAPDQPTLSTLIAGATGTTTGTTPKTMASIAASLPSREGEYQHRAAWKAGVMGALNLLAVVLAVRLVLLVAVIGALWLAKLALDVPATLQIPALVMLGVYCATVVIPMVWLSSRK